MQNPFGVSFFQAILDSIVKAAWSIFSAETLGVVLPFMIKMWIIATIVFALVSLFFSFFRYIKEKSLWYVDDNVDWFIWTRVYGKNYVLKDSNSKKSKQTINNVADDTPAVS